MEIKPDVRSDVKFMVPVSGVVIAKFILAPTDETTVERPKSVALIPPVALLTIIAALDPLSNVPLALKSIVVNGCKVDASISTTVRSPLLLSSDKFDSPPDPTFFIDKSLFEVISIFSRLSVFKVLSIII